jgi:hypothetical protein
MLNHMQVYHRLARLEIIPRGITVDALEAGTLSYNHVKVAAPIKRDAAFRAVLNRAHDGWPLHLHPSG